MQNYAQEPTNTVCPVCGMTVVFTVAPVIASHEDDAGGDGILRIGTCCEACRCRVAGDPAHYFAAAADNAVAVGG